MSMFQFGIQMVHIVQNHRIFLGDFSMKKILYIFYICFLFVSCASIPSEKEIASDVAKAEIKQDEVEYTISSDIFDTLQRPLSFGLSPQVKPINRLDWEYHMAGIGWWDIYLMTGRKLGNGIFEKSVENKSNCQIIELHNVKSEYDSSVLMVEVIFVSSDRNTLENLQAQFKMEATNFFGKQGELSDDKSITWTVGWIHYTSYPIQQHENGKWVYLVSSFDSANSPY